MEDNSGENGLIQNKDADELTQLNSGEDVSERFLNNKAHLKIIFHFQRECMLIPNSLQQQLLEIS